MRRINKEPSLQEEPSLRGALFATKQSRLRLFSSPAKSKANVKAWIRSAFALRATARHAQKALLAMTAVGLLSACGFNRDSNLDIDTTNLSQLESVEVRPMSAAATPSGLSALRVKSLKDSAMSIGAQGGLAYASEHMNLKLTHDGKYLDSIYNFNAMILSHGVLPPVLQQGDNNLNLSDPNTIRVADRTYKIVQQARFVTTPPNWREYLWQSFTKPVLPDRTLLPKSREEQRIWREGIRSGWEKGIEQSYSIFQQNLARLKRDYSGMLLYRKLLQERMISPPFVSRTELGVTGDGSDLRVNDQVLRIVDLPQLQTNSKGWHPIVVKHD